MTPDRETAYRALLSQALFDGDFFAVRGRQGDKAIANRFYNLLPLIAELREADRGAKGTEMNDKAAAVVSEEQVGRRFTLAELDSVFEAEIEHVSTFPYSSSAICRYFFTKMRARLEKSQAALGVGGWRPMDSAPRDGTPILLYLRSPWSVIEKAAWFEPWGKWIVGEFPDADEDECYGIGALVPSGWQPLPPPPSSEEG